MTRISFIIPAFNCEETISTTISSILSQTIKDIEIVIVNDGSTDNTKSIVEQLALKFDNIKLINKSNSGVSHSRNIGLEKAIGDYVMFIDGDDTIDNDFGAKLFHYSKNNVFVGGYIKKIYSKNKVEIINQKNFYTINEILEDLITGTLDGFAVRYLFKKDTLNNVRFNQKLSYMEDTFFLIEYILNNKFDQIIFLSDTFYNYYQFDNSVTNNIKNYKINIFNFVKSLDSIFELLNNSSISIDYEYYCINRKAKLIEYQLSKITNKQDYSDLVHDSQIREIIESLVYDPKIKKIWKVFLKVIFNSPYFVFKVYIFFRLFVKKIKNKGA